MNTYTRMLICLIAIAVLAAPSCAAPTPFVIGGWVFCEKGTDCNNPAVQVTNATGVSWDAENNSTSNYYRFALTGGDVSDGDTLQFDAAGCSQSSTTPHTVLQTEIDAGGFEYNITLEGSDVFAPVITSCNDTGAAQDGFCPGDSVLVNGTGLAPNTEYKLWIQPDPVSDSDELNASVDPSGSQETVTTDENGNFTQIEIWNTISAGSPINYDIVADKQDDGENTGKYNEASDGIDSANEVVGITAPIPELASIALLAMGLLMVVGLMRFERRKR